MFVVVLTGTIGSGKSTVSSALRDRGANVIDTDEVARFVVRPGSQGLNRIIELFGERFLSADGSLDRGALGAYVFVSEERTQSLNEIVHPLVHEEVAQRISDLGSTGFDGVVILEIPVFLPKVLDTYSPDFVVVVRSDPDRVLDRLINQRGLSAQDASARLARQMSNEQRIEFADYVISNTGSRDDLLNEIEELWSLLVERSGCRRL